MDRTETTYNCSLGNNGELDSCARSCFVTVGGGVTEAGAESLFLVEEEENEENEEEEEEEKRGRSLPGS